VAFYEKKALYSYLFQRVCVEVERGTPKVGGCERAKKKKKKGLGQAKKKGGRKGKKKCRIGPGLLGGGFVGGWFVWNQKRKKNRAIA